MYEDWLPVVGYEGYYEVSNLGNVRSVRYNHVGEVIYSRIIKPCTKANGYFGVVLSKQSTTTNYLVHRLVAITFLENPFDLPEVNHKDGDKTNNAITNLEWVSSSDNLAHAYRNGLKYKVGKPVVCVETGEIFESVKAANESLGITHYHIADVCNHITNHKTVCGYHWEWVDSN